MGGGLILLIILLMFGMVWFALFQLSTFIGWKKRHDQQVADKLDRMLDKLSDRP